MGCWDIFCFLCGNRSYECDDNINNSLNKQTEWLKQCTFLTATNKIIHNFTTTIKLLAFRDSFMPLYTKAVIMIIMNKAGKSATKWNEPNVGAVVQAVKALCKPELKFSKDFPPCINAVASLKPLEAVR